MESDGLSAGTNILESDASKKGNTLLGAVDMKGCIGSRGGHISAFQVVWFFVNDMFRPNHQLRVTAEICSPYAVESSNRAIFSCTKPYEAI